MVAGERGCGSLRKEETFSAQLPEEPEDAFCVLPKLLLGCGIGEQSLISWRAWGNLCFSVKPCSKTAGEGTELEYNTAVHFKGMFCFALLVEQMFLHWTNIKNILLKLFKMLFHS